MLLALRDPLMPHLRHAVILIILCSQVGNCLFTNDACILNVVTLTLVPACKNPALGAVGLAGIIMRVVYAENMYLERCWGVER